MRLCPTQVVYMTLSLFAAVHVLGSLWFAAGDTPGGWVIEEALHDMQLTRQYTRSMESRLRWLSLAKPQYCLVALRTETC